MGRLLKNIPTYLAALTIAACAKGGMTSSVRVQKAEPEIPVTTLPIEQEEPVVSDIDNPKNQPTTEPVEKPATQPTVSEPRKTTTTKPTTPTVKPVAPVTTKPKVQPALPPVNDKPAVSTATVKPVVKVPIKTTTQATSSEHVFTPLSWEKNVKTGKEWSNMIYQIIKTDEHVLLGTNIAGDIEIFCPNFRAINEEQRLNFWGQFFVSLAYRESGWNPLSTYVEKNITSKDSVTKKAVISEGLLQLSYQDDKNYPFDCGFDWEKDKNLTLKDPTKTILNPYLNLRCGIKIMAHQLKKYGRITLEKNVYWAVLKLNGKFSKIKEIAAVTRAMKVCQ